MNTAISQSNDTILAAMTERCLALNLPLWRCDSSGAILAGPMAPQYAQPWLRSPLVARWVERSARQSWGQPKPRVADLFGDCWLLPIPEFNGGRQRGIMIAMLMGPNATHAREFESACAAAKLDSDATRQGVTSLIHEPAPMAETVAKVLRWFCRDLVQAAEDRITLDEFSEQLAQAYEETNLMYRLARVMNVTSDPAQSIAMTSGQMHAIMPMAWIAVCFRPESPVAALSNQMMVAGRPPCPRGRFDDLVRQKVNSWTVDSWTRLLLPGQDELADLVGAEVIAEPITHDGGVVGAILTGNKRGPDPEVSSVETQFFDAAADFMGVFHENVARFEEQRAMFMGTLKGLTAAIDAKDRYTCGHSERVAWLAMQLARSMKMDDGQVDVVHVAGLVHDVGKIGVPEAVLQKPGRLTDEEFELIKQHPMTGYQILKDIPPLQQMLPGVRYHHERWDGRGYPDGLAGETIPLLGRILACADAFDAMSSTRAYRPALPRQKVLTEFERCAGSQFDPKLAGLFVQLDFTQFDEMLAHHRELDSSIAA